MTKLIINYWIIVVLCSVVGMLIGNGDTIPGSFMKFLSNFFMYNGSYNGAWWFMLTYIILVMLSVCIYRIIKKCNGVIVLVITSIIYLISYIIRFDIIHITNAGAIMGWFIRQGALVGTSVLPFVCGMLAYKYSVISLIRKWGADFSKYSIIALTVIAFTVCITLHAFEQSLIVAPIFALVTIGVVCLWRGKIMVIFEYFGAHSTNIWLVHMFFYAYLFEDFIFRFKYPIVIFIMMLGLSLLSSYIINFILKTILSHVKVLN